jgi:hypothetical protein
MFKRSGTAKPSSAASRPAMNGSSPSSGAAPLGQTRLDYLTNPLRAFEIFRWKRGEWFETITGDPDLYPNAVLLARAEELGAKIAGLKRTLSRPPVGMTGEAWEREAERLARLEGQQAAIADVLGMREARARGLEPPTRTRWLALGAKAKASEAASPSMASPDPLDPFEGE